MRIIVVAIAFDVLMSTELDKAKAELDKLRADRNRYAYEAADSGLKCCTLNLVLLGIVVVFILVVVVLGLVFGEG